MAKPLTRPYADLRRERAQGDPEFRRLIFLRAIKYLSVGDFGMGRWTLHNYVDATIGFDKLGEALGRKPLQLKRVLVDDTKSIKHCPDLESIIEYLLKVEGVKISVDLKQTSQKPQSARKPRPGTARKASEETVTA